MKNKLLTQKRLFFKIFGTFIIFVLFLETNNAQVIITDANLPGSGSLIRRASVSSPVNNYFSTPDSGTNLNWNYNFLQETPFHDTLSFLVPSNAPHINQYPQANLVFVTRYNIYYYYRKTSDGLYLLAIESADFPFHPSKPLMWYKYPLQIGTSFIDSATSVQTFATSDTVPYDSVKYVQTFIINARAIADGRITYNGTTAPKVVKERLLTTWALETYARDTMTGNWSYLGKQEMQRVAYRWTSDKLGFPEVEIEYNVHEDTVLSLGYVEGAVIKASALLFETQSPFEIFPNPATEHLVIKTPTNEFIRSIEIFDTKGNKVLTKKLQKSDRIKQYSLRIKELPEGLYLLKINTSKANSYLHKFLKTL